MAKAMLVQIRWLKLVELMTCAYNIFWCKKKALFTQNRILFFGSVRSLRAVHIFNRGNKIVRSDGQGI